jgi:hypothetical protein
MDQEGRDLDRDPEATEGLDALGVLLVGALVVLGVAVVVRLVLAAL